MQHYIIVARNRSMWLVGPFASQEAAAAWGRENNPQDDPRWQTIELSTTGSAYHVITIASPTAGPMGSKEPL